MKAQKLIRKGIMCIYGVVLAVGIAGCSGTTGSADESTAGTVASRSASAAATSDKSGVMLQGFNWASATESSSTTWYQTMINNAAAIKSEFAYVWFPPPSLSASAEGYLPTQLNDLDSEYGTETQLKQAISAIAPAKAVADIVINHRCGSTDWGDFTNPKWNDDFYSICRDDEGFSSSAAMMASGKRGNADTGAGYSAGRDLDHTNTDVQNGIIAWMTGVLEDAGFVGWRYDFVKGYSGYYVGKYDAATSAQFSVGEYWPSDGFNSSNWKNEIMNWINATATGGYKSRAFDFVLKGNLNYAFGYKDNLSCWNMALLADSNNLFRQAPAYAVTFIDNHDTGSTQNLWSIDPGDLGPAYAFILTHPGYPCVAWQHYFTGSTSQYKGGMSVSGTGYTLQQHINKLISIRREAGVCYDSALTVLAATTTLYVAQITGENETLIVKIGGDSYTPSGNYTNVYSGTNFAVWKGSGATGSSVTLSAAYDPGYGNALYFTGSFTEGNTWAVAVRGTWSAGNVWTAAVTVPSAGSFEWKVMKGSYSLGSSVSTSASGLTWSSNSNAGYPGTTSVTPYF
jgi:alpha-amylase